MWTVVYMTKVESDILFLQDRLKDNNIITKIRKNDSFFEILVPEAELSLAHEIIIDAEI